MTTYRLNRKHILKLIGKLLTGRISFSVSWNGKKFEINLPATFNVTEAVPEAADAAVKPWLEPKPELRTDRPQQPQPQA